MQCCHSDCLAAFHPYCAYSSGVHMAVRVDSDDRAHYELFCKKHDPTRRQEHRDGHIDAERESKGKRRSLESYRMSNGPGGLEVAGKTIKEEHRGQHDCRGTPLLLFKDSPLPSTSPCDGLQDTAEKNTQLGLLKTRKR